MQDEVFSDETEPQLQQQQQQQLAPNNVDEVRLEEPLQVSYIHIYMYSGLQCSGAATFLGGSENRGLVGSRLWLLPLIGFKLITDQNIGSGPFIYKGNPPCQLL